MANWEQRRARRDLERRMRELDRLDRDFGLGADPRQHVRRVRRPATRWVRIGGAVASLVVAVALVSVLPGQQGDQLRRLLHLPDHRISSIVGTSAHGPYAFEQTQPGTGTPVSYSPCAPIRYVVNPDGGPSDAVKMIQDAVAEASRRSGFSFDYVGTTKDRTFERSSGPVLIGFARDGEVSEMSKDGDVVGVGGSARIDNGTGFSRYVTGMVALKSGWFRREAGTGHRDEEQAVVMHELGHVLGLAHVNDEGELMNPSLTRTTYGPGDSEGLAKLGAVRCG